MKTRNAATLGLILAAALTLTACSSGADDTTAPATPDPYATFTPSQTPASDSTATAAPAAEGAALMTADSSLGTIVVDGNGYKQLDANNKEVAASTNNRGGEAGHIANFLDCIRTGNRPNCDIEEGHRSTLLCHLGNAAWRLGRTVRFDAATYTFDDDEANQYLTRPEYRAPWLLPGVEDV